MKTAKITISLPENVLQSVEKERQTSGESRSEFFRRAVEALLTQLKEAEAVELYLKGYRNNPETVSDTGVVYRAGLEILEDELW